MKTITGDEAVKQIMNRLIYFDGNSIVDFHVAFEKAVFQLLRGKILIDEAELRERFLELLERQQDWYGKSLRELVYEGSIYDVTQEIHRLNRLIKEILGDEE